MIQVKRFALCLVERGPSQCLLLWLNPFSDSTPALISMEYSFYHYGFVNLGPTVSDVIKLTFSWSYLIFLPASLWVQLLFAFISCPSCPCLFLKVAGFQSWIIPSSFSCCPFLGSLFSGPSCFLRAFLVVFRGSFLRCRVSRADLLRPGVPGKCLSSTLTC